MRRILFIFFLLTVCNSLIAQYSYNVNAIQTGCNKHQLTTNANTQLGSVWYQTRIDLNNSFDYTFDVYLGTNDGGADGLVFVLQNSGLTATGTGGGGIGFQGLPGNSLGIEIDTWANSGACPSDNGDPIPDHIGILKNGSPVHCSTNSLAGPVVVGAGGNIEDGQVHAFRVKWDATLKLIEVYFDGPLVLSKTEDMVNTIFGGNPLVYWGFTGSTGGANNVQWFRTKLQAVINTTVDTKCESDSRIFTNNSLSFFPIAKFYWSFDDGSPMDSVNNTIGHAYSAGSHTTKLKIRDINGCEDSVSYTEFIHPKPVAHFTWNNACVGTAVQFTDSSYFAINDNPPGNPPANFWWRMPDGSTYTSQNVSYTFTAPGSYTIYHVSTSLYSCKSDTVQRTINVQPLPFADFTFTNNSCQGTAVQFTDISSIFPGVISTWDWDFGDGGTSPLQNPTHIFANTGPQTVTLIVNGTSCSNSITKTVNIVGRPTAYFKNGNTCQFATIVFTDSSYTIGGSAVTGWWWDLGNGQFSTNQNPTAIYSIAGPVTVRLVVTNANGCISDTFSKQIIINGKPVANFTHNDSCLTNNIQFTDASTLTGGAINNWWWDLGNSSTSILQNPITTYSTNGFKTIKLVVGSLEGCASDTLFKTIRIYTRPLAGFTFNDSACLGAVMNFTDNSTWSDGVINTWNWNFGDGSPSANTQNTSHIYTTPGIHPVTLINTGINGNCAGTITKNVFVVDKPVAYFKYAPVCQFSSLTLQDSSYTRDGLAVTGWWWDLGNGQFSNLPNPVVTYNTSGTITIKQVVYNSRGCISDTTIRTITINSKPVAKFGNTNSLCAGLTVQFSDSSVVSGGTVSQWNWIQNGTPVSTVKNPSLVFTAGSQTIQLVVTSNTGCISDTFTKTLFIETKPAIAMAFTNACKNSPVSFAATINNGAGIATWNWNFGDGSIGNANPAAHTYAANGTYLVSLYAISTAGCYSDTLKNNIIIFSTNAFAGNDTIAAAGQPIQLNASGGVSYEWIPTTGLNNPFISNPVTILNQTQQYILKAFTPQGCTTYDTVLIKIYKGPDIYLPNAFTPNGDGLNDVLRGIPVGIKEFKYLKIFNRWGQELFSTSDYRKGWNGEWKGQKQETGAYVVIASGVDFKGNVINKKGSVMLLR